MMELQLEDIQYYYNYRVYCVKFDCLTLQESLNDMAEYSKGVEADVKAVYGSDLCGVTYSIEGCWVENVQNSTIFRKKSDSNKFLVQFPYSPTLVDYDIRNEIYEYGNLYEYPTYHLYKIYMR